MGNKLFYTGQVVLGRATKIFIYLFIYLMVTPFVQLHRNNKITTVTKI